MQWCLTIVIQLCFWPLFVPWCFLNDLYNDNHARKCSLHHLHVLNYYHSWWWGGYGFLADIIEWTGAGGLVHQNVWCYLFGFGHLDSAFLRTPVSVQHDFSFWLQVRRFALTKWDRKWDQKWDRAMWDRLQSSPCNHSSLYHYHYILLTDGKAV